MPENVELINIEVDMKCNEKKKYQQVMRTHILTQKKRICGLRIFEQKELDKNKALHWVFGVKIFKTIRMETDDDETDDDESFIER